MRDALQALLDASDEQYFALDLDGRYLAFNEAHVDEMRTLYGVDIALGDRQTDSSITPTDREAALASHRRVLAGERFVLEAELGEEGGRRCFELTHAPLADTAGATVGLTVRVKDITERRRLERELDEERRRFELLVEHSSEATLLCHPDGAILTANPAACRMFGRTEEELREIGRAGLVDETDPRYPDGLERRRQTGRHEGELRMVRVDGTSFPAEVSTTVFTDPAGNERTSVIIRDLTERAAAEAALRESEAMRDVAEKVSLTGSYRFDLSTQKLTVSPGMYRVYDAAPGEFGGDPTKVMAERLHPEDQGKMRQAWKDFARTGEPALLEHRVVHRDGTIHSLSGGGEVVYDAAGNAVALAGYFRDVSEQRAAEGALRESEELHRSILSASPDDITVADLEGRILVVSPTAAKMFGYQRDEEAIGRSLTDFLVPEQREYANGRLALLFQEPPPGPEEYVGLRADGSTLPLEVHGAPIHDEDGRPARIVLVIRDITDRRRAELELRDSQEQLALAVEGSGAGLWDWHVQTGEAAFNERWAEIVGYSIDELEPLSIATWTDLCHPEDFGRSTKLLEEHFSGRSPRYECEARMRHKDGHWVWVMDRGKVSEWDEEGRPLRMAGTHLDITERKQAEAVITHLNAELEERIVSRTEQRDAVARELEAFAYSVAHDVRTPLRAIDGFSAMVLDDDGPRLSAASVEHLERAREAAQRMGRLLDDLLGLSRVSRYELHRSRVDLSAQVAEVAAEVATDYPGRSVEQSIHPGMTADADPTLTRMIVRELLANAWKFTGLRETAHIEVGVDDSGATPVLFVRDDGAGFDMRAAAHLFGVFQRMHPSDQFPGHGIGLATVQRLVLRQGGRVWAEAEVDKGATISFTLPAPTAVG